MPDSILHFNGEWRSYQKRILDKLDFHLRDDKLHVVAAPGAGKTTLGIEVISRLNRPSLILFIISLIIRIVIKPRNSTSD